MTLTLGIETSTRQGSIALSRDGEILTERSLGPVSQRHATSLFVEIDSAFREFGLKPSNLDRIGVGVGPGSFTGLRIGVVAAKTLAYALQCDVKPIDSFLAVAQSSPSDVREITVVGDAQRGDLFVGRYRRQKTGHWEAVAPISIEPVSDFLNALEPDAVVSGTGISRCDEGFPPHVRLLDPSLRDPRATAICQLTDRADLAPIDPIQLVPFYLRKSSAEEKWEREHPEE